MRADRTQIAVGGVFHLAIHVRVREKVAALDELVLPNVGTMKLEGDERNVTASAAGTDVVETLTLEPTVPGAFTITGAYLDAIDARTHKPSRFSANSVRVVAGAPAPEPLSGFFWRLLLGMVLVGSAVLAVIAGLVAIVLMERRRKQPVVLAAAPVAPPPPRLPRDDVADALRAYRSAPANGSLTRLRGALFVAAGTNAGATLRDALAATSDRELRDALTAAERTAFGPAHERDAASADLVGATDSWLSSVPAQSSR